MKTLYIIPGSFHSSDSQLLYKLKKRLGINLITSEIHADYALPIYCASTYKLIVSNSRLSPMSSIAHRNLTNKLNYKNLVNIFLPTIAPMSQSELLSSELGTGKIFIKRQFTYYKNRQDKLAYSYWNSAQEFINSIPSDFWYNQNNPNSILGPYIIQRFIPYPYQSLWVNISINNQSEIYFWGAMTAENIGADIFGTVHTYTESYIDAKETISRLSMDNLLMAGLHTVEFALIDNTWVFMDWNARLSYGMQKNYTSSLTIDTPILDAAISHMMSIPYFEDNTFYAEQRNYRNLTLTKEYAVMADSFGLQARFDDSLQIISKIAGIAETKTALDIKFNLFNNNI